MKIVINACYGGFGIKDEIVNQYGFSKYSESRTNKKLIELIESGVDCNDGYSHLTVVYVPDEATDYFIDEYDGNERVICVIDGKLHFLY